MAMIARRTLLAGAGAQVLAAATASAQQPLSAERFIEAAYASALFQAQIANLARARDVRPEVKQLAERVAAFRDGQIGELAVLARDAGVEVRDTLDLELRVLVDNLEPLDSLAMSRRYVEVERQALEREMAAYRDMAAGGAGSLQDYARDTLPTLEELSRAAETAQQAVTP